MATEQMDMIDVIGKVKNAEGKWEDKVIARQKLCPPDTPKFNPPWVSERENYLFSNGWEKEPSITGGLATYKDPKGSRLNGEVKFVKNLPNKGDDLNPNKPLHQLHLPPAFNSFTLEEAVDIQARRDAAGEGGVTMQERVEALEKSNNDKSDEVRVLKGIIKSVIVKRDINADGLKMLLRKAMKWEGSDNPDDWKI